MSTGDVHRGPRRLWVEMLVVALSTLVAIVVLQLIWGVRWQWMASVAVGMVFICAVPALVAYVRWDRPQRLAAIPRGEMTQVARPRPPVGGGAGSQGWRPDEDRSREGASVTGLAQRPEDDRPAPPVPVAPLVEPVVYRWTEGDAPPRTEIIGPTGSPTVGPERWPNGGHRP